MKVGIRETTLRQPLETAFTHAAEIGFDGLELCIRTDPMTHAVWSPEGRTWIQHEAARTGVEVCALSAGGLGALYTGDAPGSVAQGAEATRRTIEAARAVGAATILVPLGGPAAKSYDEVERGYIAGLRAAAPAAEQAGVRLGMESVGRDHTQDAARFERLLDAIDSPAVGVYWDVGNAPYQGYDPIEGIRRLAARGKLFQVHMKEIGKEMGEGDINFDAIFAAFADVGYDGYLVLETAAGDDPLANARRNYAFLRRYLDTGTSG